MITDKNSTKFGLPKPVHVLIENDTVPENENKGLIQNKNSLTNTKITESRPRNTTDYEKGHKDMCKNSWQEDYTKLHQHLIETNKNKFYIVLCPGGGWGNRLRDLINSFHFAVVAKRAFIIYCDIPNSPLDRFLAPRYIKWNYKVNETQLTVRHAYKVKLNDIKNVSDPKTFEQTLNYSVEYNVGFEGNKNQFLANLLKYDLPVWPNIRQMMGCTFYYLFKKSDMLQKRLGEWKEKLGFNRNIVIGIHIRQGDSVFHHNMQDTRFKNTKDIDLGFDCALQIQKEIEKKYKTDKIIWFLAADSEKMKTRAKQKYGDKVRSITGPIEHVGHVTKGNEDAAHLSMFLDFFLLQDADYRLYPGPSTFDNAVDYITLGSQNAARSFSRWKASQCVIPPSLKP